MNKFNINVWNTIMRYLSYYAIPLVVTLLFCIQIQAFCIYNNLVEGAFFNIYDEPLMGNDNAFRKTLHNGAKECCHYSNSHCNPSQLSRARMIFVVRFKFPEADHHDMVYRLACDAGAGLSFHGGLKNYYALCWPPNRESFRPMMTPVHFD